MGYRDCSRRRLSHVFHRFPRIIRHAGLVLSSRAIARKDLLFPVPTACNGFRRRCWAAMSRHLSLGCTAVAARIFLPRSFVVDDVIDDDQGDEAADDRADQRGALEADDVAEFRLGRADGCRLCRIGSVDREGHHVPGTAKTMPTSRKMTPKKCLSLFHEATAIANETRARPCRRCR